MLKRKGISTTENDNKIIFNVIFKDIKSLLFGNRHPGYIACKDLIDKSVSEIGKQSIKLLVMSGICAGWKEKTKLGDIVVADLVYHYATSMSVNENALPQFDVIHQFNLNVEINKWVK